jgi:rhamnose utilization protein RhaD (predicted bifunctional aldolase and dehydrogenase)/NAD(P)-dependent dehydrogenase (short-subunit alcohol dehydrogenase family)
MKSLWDDAEASAYRGELALRVYTSRLLGRDKSLVLHGGGNTSVKLAERDLLGDEREVLYVKGSGWDLETIEPAGFTPVLRDHLVRLASLPRLSDPQMVNEMMTHRTDAGAPAPSVEAILHAVLPARYVDHTHADAVVALTNSPGGAERAREVWGDSAVIVPYVMPGFELARHAAELFARDAHAGTVGMILLSHGVFSFGDTARESYERMIELVERAERYLERQGAWELPEPPAIADPAPPPVEVARLRRDLSAAAGFPLIVTTYRTPRTLAFARRPDIAVLSQQGPATPDHVIRTRRLPLLGRDVAAYAAAYRAEFDGLAPGAAEPKTPLDPAPRVVVDAEFGLLAAGRTAGDAAVAAEIYLHTEGILERAAVLGGYRALSPREIFDMEYWDLEQAKLKRAGAPPAFAGEVALVTGAASGIGRAAVDALLARGAAVVGLDLNPEIAVRKGKGFVGIQGDVTDENDVARALEAAAGAFGGLDLLVLNAGIFPPARQIRELGTETFRRSLAVNAESNLAFLREAHPYLALAPRGGRVVVVASKNVPAPGPGAAAYSAAKAAVTQLARVAALEWGADGIRVNVVHPNAVFDTALWDEPTLASRAAAYGLSVEEYRRSNVLRAEVSSSDVAEVIVQLLGAAFSRTTGAQIPVDGGNERVI